MKSFRYLIGALVSRLGYTMKPSWKCEQGTLNPVELAAFCLASADRLDFVLQIGAFDGRLHDPIHQIIKLCKTRVVLVEPQPAAAAKLRSLYEEDKAKVTIIEAAIAGADGESLLYADHEMSPRASLNKDHLSRFNLKGSVTTPVKTLRPSSLLANLGLGAPDLLQIDTEGFDWQILRLFFEENIYPPVIHFEHIHLPKAQRMQARDQLTMAGYSWIEYEWNTLAVLPGIYQSPLTNL